ncbi:MAG TPA: T9SS type A sorting domain-containing protein [Ferruginibacter sp.]|jgi:hypothetical protein|nr:T9SS type A sorting domain-containing protein [Ferruginibacter sp.]
MRTIFTPLYTMFNNVQSYLRSENTTNQEKYFRKFLLSIAVVLCFAILSTKSFSANRTGINSVQINKSDKNIYTHNHFYLFSPGSVLSQPEISLRTTLYGTDTAHVITYLADGVLNIFGSTYKDTLNWSEDIGKLFNLSQTVAIFNYNQYLSIERSPLAKAGDTINLSIGKLIRSQPYQFIIQTTNFTRPDLNAFLIDSYTNISTPILLGDTSVNINFTITSDPASYVSNRFTIIFKATPGNVAYTNIKATTQNKNIDLQWRISNQSNIKEYIVERSSNGTDFTVADTLLATADTSSFIYNWIDTNTVNGNNYYRVYAVDKNLLPQDTSNITSVFLSEDITPITADSVIASFVKVYPNPVTNGIVSIDLTGWPAGNYEIKIFDLSGNTILRETKYYGSNNDPVAISFGKNVNPGIYIIQIIAPNKNTIKVTIENQ